MVPFKAVYEFLKNETEGLTAGKLADYTNVSVSSIKNYNAGFRKGKPCAPQQNDQCDAVFLGICSDKLYDVTPYDYKEKATRLINHLKNETTLLYLIARKYRLGETGLDEEINKGFEESVKKILPKGDGQIDLTHPAY